MNSYLPKVLSERGFLPYEERQESILLKCINRYLYNELERAKRNGIDDKNISGFYKDMTNEDIEFFENSIFERITDDEIFEHDLFTMDMYRFSAEEDINCSNIIVKLNNLSNAEIEIMSNSTSVLNSKIFPGYEITSIDSGYTYFNLKIHPGFVDACKAVNARLKELKEQGLGEKQFKSEALEFSYPTATKEMALNGYVRIGNAFEKELRLSESEIILLKNLAYSYEFVMVKKEDVPKVKLRTDDHPVTTSVRMYEQVWKRWQAFSQEWSIYTSLDMMASALEEFMDKHSFEDYQTLKEQGTIKDSYKK